MSAIEKKLGMGNGTIGKWGKNGRVPNYANLCAVADALGVAVADLTGESSPSPSKKAAAPGEEDELLRKIQTLNEQERRDVEKYLDFLSSLREKP